MAFISHNKFWENEFYNMVSKKDKVQGMNFNQLKLKVHNSYGKDEKISTNFEPTDNSDVINKAYLDDNFLEIDGHLSLLEKNYNEFNLHYNKQSAEKVLIRTAVQTTIEKL